ncbi:MAG: TonB-dependent receptor [Rhodospirillaceae bacterium]
MRFISARTLLLGTVAATTMLGGQSVVSPASAQQLAVEEIVVTARQREERLQDIPLSIAAFSAADIREQGFRDLGDIVMQTSGVTFDPRASSGTGGRINSQIRIRGVATGGSLPHIQPVSLFVDGVYSLGGANVLPLNELERVEIIKGPQSAFFGRNTFAGAINYITRTPSLEEYEMVIDATAATRGIFDFSTIASAPLVEGKMAVQLAARMYARGAQYTATDGGGLGEEESNSISGVIYAEPNEDIKIKARVFYQEDDDGHPVSAFFRAQTLSPTCLGQTRDRLDDDGNPATLTLGAYYCGVVPGVGETGAPPVDLNTSLRPGLFALVRPAFDGVNGGFLPPAARPDYLIDTFVNGPPFVEGAPSIDHMGLVRKTFRTSLNLDWEFADGYNFNMTGGYNDSDLNYILDFDRTPIESWYTNDPQVSRDYSVEARISSPGEERLRWLGGATYYNQKFVTSGAGGLAINSCFGTCAVGPGLFGLPATGGNLAEVWGVYGSVSYDITEELTFDAEVRYLEDERTSEIRAGSFVQGFAATYKQWTPRFILTYRPTDETTVYAQVSRGSLPGVTNGLVAICSDETFLQPYEDPLNPGTFISISECDQLARQFPSGESQGSTPSQKLDALEIGWKQSAFDNTLNFNLTGYYYTWKNLPSGVQVRYVRDADDPNLRDRLPNQFPNTLGVSVSGKQKLWGLELESGWQATENLSMQFNASWNQNEWSEFRSTSAPFYPSNNYKGLEQARYPEWMGNLTTTYEDILINEWNWYVRGNVSYMGEQWVDFENLASIEDYFLIDAFLGVQREGLRVEVFVRNLFDDDSWVNGSRGVDFSSQGDLSFSLQGIGLVPQQKRTFGIRTNLEF